MVCIQASNEYATYWAPCLLTGRVEQSAHALIFIQLVVPAYGIFGLQDMRRNVVIAQELHGCRCNLQPFVNTLGNHDDFDPVIQQFLDICRAHSRRVIRACLTPIPLPCAAGKKFGILELLPAFDLQLPPGKLRDTGGFLLSIHGVVPR